MSGANRAKNALVAAGSLVGLAAIVGTCVYVHENRSGHTGVDPYFLLWLFVPLAAVGAKTLLLSSRPERARWTGLAALAVGLVGMALLVWLDWSGTMLHYEEWVKRGME